MMIRRVGAIAVAGLAAAFVVAYAGVGTESAYASVAPIPESCFGCSECGTGAHVDGAGATSQGWFHPDCSPGGCYDAHYGYGLSAAPSKPDPRNSIEIRGLVAHVEAAAANEDGSELADLARSEAHLRVNYNRKALQVVVGHEVIAHVALSEATFASLVSHH